MKTIQKLSLLVALCLVAMTGYAQERNIDWIHGLGGDATSWNNLTSPPFNPTARNYKAAREITQFTNGTYPTGIGVPDMAYYVNNATGGANTIAIGHSMGGVAAREIDINNTGHWIGIITLGSPLRGARIVDAVQNGEAQALINNGINQLMKGPQAGSVSYGPIPGAGVVISVTAMFGNISSNGIAGAVVNLLANKLSLTYITTAHLSPNGLYMNNPLVQNINTPTPKINIWGSESDPLMWRLAGTFKDGDDEKGVSTLNAIAGKYGTYADAEYSMGWLMGGIFQTYFNWRGDQWKAGHDWAMYTSNDAWAQLIGAAYNQTYSGATPKMICDYNYYYTTCGSSPNPDACRAQCWVWQPYSYTYYIKTDSDGVVPASSQRNDGGAWKNVVIKAVGDINHQEHLRWDRIEPTLNDVFDLNYPNPNQVFRINRN